MSVRILKLILGGVGIYLSNNLKDYSIRSDLALGAKHCEDIWIDIPTKQACKKPNTNKTTNIVIGVIYRHPNHHYDMFCEKLCNTINILNSTKTNYIIVGDLNIDLLKFNLATDVTNYINSLYSVGCNICIDKPTRVAENSATCIDHIYTNMLQDSLVSKILLSDVSDHYSTITNVGDFSKSSNKTDIYFRKCNLSEKEWDKYNFGLGAFLKNEFPTGPDCDVNNQANTVSRAYKIMSDKHMPEKNTVEKATEKG